jgi:hypothetical protein
MGSMKLHRTSRAWCLSALAAGALAGGLVAPRAASANASGCTLRPATHPSEDAKCAGGGNGCYLCEYSDPAAGYMTCSESPDGTEIYCIPGQHALNQYSGDRWVPQGPVSPARGAVTWSAGAAPREPATSG